MPAIVTFVVGHRKAEEARKKLRELQEMIGQLHDYVSSTYVSMYLS